MHVSLIKVKPNIFSLGWVFQATADGSSSKSPVEKSSVKPQHRVYAGMV